MMEHEVLDYDEPTLDKISKLLLEAMGLAKNLKGTRFQGIHGRLMDINRELLKADMAAENTPNEPEPKDKYGLSDEEDASLRNIIAAVGKFDLGRSFE